MSGSDIPELKLSPNGTCHASAIAIGDCGALIIGPSGCGKSGLALELMALGAELIADDRCALHPTEDGVEISAPPGLPACIEARGIGLIAARCRARAPLSLVIDLSRTSAERLPEPAFLCIRGHRVRCLQKIETRSFPAAIVQYLKAIGAGK